MTDNRRLTPAALMAAARGDLPNAIIAATPGGINAQEAAGQRDMTRSFRILPKGMDRAIAEQFGFVFGEDADDLFVNVTAPEGWTLRPSDHAMWSYIHDAQGRRRGAVFYKAAFYDRSAHGRWEPRYTVDRDHDGQHVYTAIKAVDGATGETLFSEAVPDGEGSNYEVYSAIEQRIWDRLTEQFPDHRDPAAYWPR